MTDLSKIPDLELRQKAKELDDAIDRIDLRIEEMTAPLQDERQKLYDQLDELLDGRSLDGRCEATGLPIFDGDDVLQKRVLACVEA